MKAGLLTCTTTCSQWKRKLREALAYTILNYEEKTLAVNVFSDQSDETCAVWLEKLQREYKLTATCGFIPAALFYTAIMERRITLYLV